MATFFGEVTELSSRAVWWSDSEDEHDESSDNNEIVKRNFSSSVEVPNNGSLVDSFRSQCKLLYLSLGRDQQHLIKKCILCLKFLKSNGKNGNIATLYLLNSTEYWLQINDAFAAECNELAPKLVDTIAENIFKDIKSNFEILIISKDLHRSQNMQYFASNSETIQRVSQNVTTMKPFLPPETIKNHIELALLEYCIVRKMNFACIALPSSLYDVSSLVPKQIVDNLQQLSGLCYLNLIT